MHRLACFLAVWLAVSAGAVTAPVPFAPMAVSQRLTFREPADATYIVERPGPAWMATAEATAAPWIIARRESGADVSVRLGNRVVLQLDDPAGLAAALEPGVLRVDRVLAPNLYILQAPDVWTAATESARLATRDGVLECHPVRWGAARLQGRYAPAPNDPFFGQQWHLENRDPATATPVGIDLNARSAWSDNLGLGIVIGQGDDGVETAHPDLAANTAHNHHHNFISGAANGLPVVSSQIHGTAVAGLIAARGDNALGVTGVAPRAQLASLVIFDSTDSLGTEEQVMDAFQYRSNIVSVQNHSWGNASTPQLPLSTLESQGIGNAVTFGRGGLGVVFVRAAGNFRTSLNDVNDDGYGQDPRVITVGAVRTSGRAASYSTSGAAVLVAAPSGDDGVTTSDGAITNYQKLATTDRVGSLGYNRSGANPDYGLGGTAFSGTSASSPQIAGLCALLLAANPNLSYRDVQQILILASRQTDPADPDIQINGAGLAVSHAAGFGVPDAGRAVELARSWTNRPARTSATATFSQSFAIPDDGLRVVVSGPDLPLPLASIPAYPADGLHADEPTTAVPLVDVGTAQNSIATDLTGRAALIQRGAVTDSRAILNAAAAGARFAVISSSTGVTNRTFLQNADLRFCPIPAVCIDRASGDGLRTYLASPDGATATAFLQLNSVKCPMNITATLLCEHVKVHAVFSHPRRSDVRMTLVSPAGTRSVLHHFNNDTSRLDVWDFYSTHHFYESSAGTWRVEISDEKPGATGSILSLALTVFGVAQEDVDHDGLDDRWETNWFGNLAAGPRDDPDKDGLSNLQEQLLGKDPTRPDWPLSLDLSAWDENLWRLSWPASDGYDYELLGRPQAGAAETVIDILPGRYPELEWFLPVGTGAELYRVRQSPRMAR